MFDFIGYLVSNLIKVRAGFEGQLDEAFALKALGYHIINTLNATNPFFQGSGDARFN
ncbi:hypothetical protein [Candidatus Coxiella mudrowiae]|uniref:hypothetical protein n=1 Tax=Candidatus Coxiella mudrowiae TaxID=2054173 RepID=UPI001FD339B0|nr:hypothetical protein [Candidatus Coxiella mudrowiae]